MENNQKMDNTLNLALDITQEQREKSRELQNGYEAQERIWRVIVKYTGTLAAIEEAIEGVQGIELFNQYGIVRVPESRVDDLADLPQIQYVEKPKQVYFSLDEGRSASCINSVQGTSGGGLGLTGRGVLVGLADSGMDITHPAFRQGNGRTRILFLWDQQGSPNEAEGLLPPERYGQGAEWSAEQIDRVLSGEAPSELRLPGDTGTGHGTAAAGIAAGNGSGSVGNRFRGVAVESPLIFVKLGSSGEGFPRTTEVMEALDYIVRKAVELQMPVAVNLSFGNNYGAHNGQGLFESYITDLAGIWQSVFAIASGNEGDARHHTSVRLGTETEVISFAIGENETNLSLQIWKNYVDEIAVFIETPEGVRTQIARQPGQSEQLQFRGATLLIYYGEPSPYTTTQEIYLEWIPSAGQRALPDGVWRIWLVPDQIRDGKVELWLPTIEAVGMSTGFLNPVPDTTLTIPSTARKIITVGAYRTDNDSVAVFSGRGDTTDRRNMPTIVAPGVDIMTTAPGGGYSARTGTSMAAPFVTGSAALMMEWGIVQKHDIFLYGEKVKAYLQRGARPLPGFTEYPNPQVGYGALCVKSSLPV